MEILQMWLIGWAAWSSFSALIFLWWHFATKKRLQRALVAPAPARRTAPIEEGSQGFER